jgi:uncharacterized protein (TIRG00374 family)
MHFRRLPKWVGILCRYTFGALLIYWLLTSNILDLNEIVAIDKSLIMMGGFLVFVQLCLSSLRVKIVLHGQGVCVRFLDCMLFNSIGVFYSIFLPGGISGDIGRAYFFWRKYPDTSKTSLAAALFLDRFIGLAGLISTGVIAALLLFDISKTLAYYMVGILIIGIMVAVSCFYLYQKLKIIVAKKNSRVNRVIELFEKFIFKMNIRNYSFNSILIIFSTSLAIHFISVVIIYEISLTVISGLSFLQISAVTPIGLLVNALPISPGGLGVGEKSFDMLFDLMNGDNGGNTFFLARLIFLLPAFFGGALVLKSVVINRFKRTDPINI